MILADKLDRWGFVGDLTNSNSGCESSLLQGGNKFVGLFSGQADEQ